MQLIPYFWALDQPGLFPTACSIFLRIPYKVSALPSRGIKIQSDIDLMALKSPGLFLYAYQAGGKSHHLMAKHRV